jgi:hypothetical protein
MSSVALVWSRFTDALINLENLSTQHIQAEFNIPEFDLDVDVTSGSTSESPGPGQMKVRGVRGTAHLEIPVIPVAHLFDQARNVLTLGILLVVLLLVFTLLLKAW